MLESVLSVEQRRLCVLKHLQRNQVHGRAAPALSTALLRRHVRRLGHWLLLRTASRWHARLKLLMIILRGRRLVLISVLEVLIGLGKFGVD